MVRRAQFIFLTKSRYKESRMSKEKCGAHATSKEAACERAQEVSALEHHGYVLASCGDSEAAMQQFITVANICQNCLRMAR